MYYQEIIISPDIFNKISNYFSESTDYNLDLKSYYSNLKNKTLVVDLDENDFSIFKNEINEIYKKSSKVGKDKINLIIKEFTKSNRILDIKSEKFQNICDKKIVNCVLNLGLLSKSKIINSEDENIKDKVKQNEDLRILELIDLNEFIKPPNKSNLFSIERQIEIKRGDSFKFESILYPYINSTLNISITDRYLRKRNGGFLNLVRLLKCCNNLKKITINTILYDSKDLKFDISTGDLRKYIKKEFGILPVIKNTKEHQRTIVTDYYLITFEPGLDFVNEDYIALRHNIDIKIKHLF